MGRLDPLLKILLTAQKYRGNLIVIAGSTLAIVGLTFGGIRFPWSSTQVLVPLVLGLFLVCAFLLYEAKIPREPTIPWEVLANRTSFGGYVDIDPSESHSTT